MTKIFIATDYDNFSENDSLNKHYFNASETELQAVEQYGKNMHRAPKFVYEVVNKKEVILQTPKYCL